MRFTVGKGCVIISKREHYEINLRHLLLAESALIKMAEYAKVHLTQGHVEQALNRLFSVRESIARVNQKIKQEAL